MRTVFADTLQTLARDIFVARAVPADDAAWIAALLVRACAEAAGVRIDGGGGA